MGEIRLRQFLAFRVVMLSKPANETSRRPFYYGRYLFFSGGLFGLRRSLALARQRQGGAVC